MSKDTGGPAFPRPGDFNPQTGMTLRDYLAAKAMRLSYKYWNQDFFDQNHFDNDERIDQSKEFDESMMELIAIWSYKMADAMLKARQE